MSDDDLSDSDLFEEIFSNLETIESFPRPYWLPENFLAEATTRFVRALAPHIEAGETVIKSDDSGRPALAVPLDDLILRFGRAAILRMAKSREPNKAFGYLRDAPGYKLNPWRERVEATRIGAYVELGRRAGRGLTATIDFAAGVFRCSKGTVRARLEILAEAEGHTDIKKGLESFFNDSASEDLIEALQEIGIEWE